MAAHFERCRYQQVVGGNAIVRQADLTRAFVVLQRGPPPPSARASTACRGCDPNATAPWPSVRPVDPASGSTPASSLRSESSSSTTDRRRRRRSRDRTPRGCNRCPPSAAPGRSVARIPTPNRAARPCRVFAPPRDATPAAAAAPRRTPSPCPPPPIAPSRAARRRRRRRRDPPRAVFDVRIDVAEDSPSPPPSVVPPLGGDRSRSPPWPSSRNSSELK